MFKKILKTDKIFLLIFTAPAVVLVKSFFEYKNQPYMCSPKKCDSFFEYLIHPYGPPEIIYIIFSTLFFLPIILSLFFIFNNKKRLGYIFLTTSILVILIFLLYSWITTPRYYL